MRLCISAASIRPSRPERADLGAITPDEIAISILAELVSARRLPVRG